ncbi:neuroligin-4, X-linked-like [Mytilus edulis]|uniref:neuroligin-4, X-linked-like n=1 Tax=Mytilus edulis TaxID=6550 RepID=UPI0039EF7734
MKLFCVFTLINQIFSTLINSNVRHTMYGEVRGFISSRVSGIDVEEYLGVPYAAPPIGKLRFKRPEDPAKWWPNILDTKKIPPACPTYDLKYIQVHKPTFNMKSEDCLYMNVYVPKVEKSDLPVHFFIHGGDNADGMGAMFDGDILAAHGQMIVITINYRVGVLGFYAKPEQGIKGNNGLMDQVKAMRWVKENIGFFEGDPSKVTIHGHSAGAGDVGLHLMSNLTHGLFRYAIIHSGSPLAHWMMSSCVKTSRQSDIPTSCKQDTSPTNKKVEGHITNLVAGSTIDDFLSSIVYGQDVFKAVVDGEYLTESPDKLFTCQAPHVDSVLFMMARDEGFEPRISQISEYYRYKSIDVFLEQYKHMFPKTFERDIKKVYEEWKTNNISQFPHYLHMSADIVFFMPMIKLADMISEWMKDVYVLSFEYISQNISGPDYIGVQHGWDLFYVFGQPLVGHPGFTYTPRDAAVARETMTLISDFVKNGYLSAKTEGKLQTYNSSMKTYYRFDYYNQQTNITLETNFREPRTEFWYKRLFTQTFECSGGNEILTKIEIYSFIAVLCILLK